MPVSMEDVRSGTIREALCEEVEAKLLKILNESDLTLRELIYVIGLMLADVGGSLEGVKEKLSYDTMWRRYAVEPTLGNALMGFSGDIFCDWLRIKEDKDG